MDAPSPWNVLLAPSLGMPGAQSRDLDHKNLETSLFIPYVAPWHPGKAINWKIKTNLQMILVCAFSANGAGSPWPRPDTLIYFVRFGVRSAKA